MELMDKNPAVYDVLESFGPRAPHDRPLSPDDSALCALLEKNVLAGVQSRFSAAEARASEAGARWAA
jgi:hypothetical protein